MHNPSIPWVTRFWSLFKDKEARRADHMRGLLSSIPFYAIQAERCKDLGGEEEERKYWLDLYKECHNQQFRSVLVPRRGRDGGCGQR